MTTTDPPTDRGAAPTSPSDAVPATSASPVVPGRIELDACLGPGTSDSRRLLVTWFVKKSFYWMFFGGAALASIIHFVERVENDFRVNYRSPESVEHGLMSAWVLVVLAVLIRFAIGWAALVLAFPLARSREVDLEPRTGWNRLYATLSDRYKVAKAFRALRWTHHVRQVALDRVSPGASWWRRTDPILDIANVLGVVAFFAAGLAFTTISLSDLLF